MGNTWIVDLTHPWPWTDRETPAGLASGMAPYLELNTSTEGEALCTRCAVGRPSRPASATRASAEYVSAAVAVTVEGVSGRKP